MKLTGIRGIFLSLATVQNGYEMTSVLARD